MNGKDLVTLINSPATREQFKLALPEHIRPERFARILTTCVMNDDKLRSADPRQLLSEACQVAALGLVTDPQLGEAWLIADHRGGVQRRVGYRGLIKLARQGGIKTIYAEDVCENDHFSIVLGTDKRIEHRPVFKDRGKPYLYYAVMIDEDGNSDFEYMTMEELLHIRDNKSDGWKAFRAGKIRSTPWGTDEGEMCKKTVLRRLLKRAPMSSDRAELLARALEAEDGADRSEMRDVTPEPTAPRKISTLDDLVSVSVPGDEPEHVSSANDTPHATETPHDALTGEIIEPGQEPGLSVWLGEGRYQSVPDIAAAYTVIAGQMGVMVGAGSVDDASEMLSRNSDLIDKMKPAAQRKLEALVERAA